jgi:secondary thiamine-phosphate synthase enzyme
MKVFQKTVSVETKELNDFVAITSQVQKVVEESKIRNGMVFINSLHNTAAIIIQENDSTIHRDLISTLEKIVPVKGKYEHDYEGNANAAAHIKSNLLGSFLTVAIENGELVLGTWQQLFFVELFEARTREVIVTILGE